MKLEEILSGIKIKTLLPGFRAGVEIAGITLDSKKVQKGYLFAALRGARSEGCSFLAEAAARGAAAAFAEDFTLAGCPIPSCPELALFEVGDARLALLQASSNFYGRPARKLKLIGITGTNGKTTTSYIIDSGLRSAGFRTGLIGTISYIIGGVEKPAPYTTPEAPEFQELLKKMLEGGASHVTAEVSSHALAQKRIDPSEFKVGVFTNLTRDHLDYHGTMEDYFASKRLLFSDEFFEEGGVAVINSDDPYGKELASGLKIKRGKGKIITYSVADGASDIRGEAIGISMKGLSFSITQKHAGVGHTVCSPLVGMHNVYNILAAYGALAALGVPAEKALEGIGRLSLVRGRFEKVTAPGGDSKVLVIVDYAHTPDALESLIAAARSVLLESGSKGKVITLFGCGGDRDSGKRPQMGRIAVELSDYAVLTSDNPRGEDPLKIIEDIKKGFPSSHKNYTVIPDRESAIKEAILMAAPGDIVLLAGKGHEDYQIIKDKKYPFSDSALARKTLEAPEARKK
jgi:UDP-N-acetylmuramoyl-L-alanyl-D-glutamate--2,6-diaminopimelate ligase